MISTLSFAQGFGGGFGGSITQLRKRCKRQADRLNEQLIEQGSVQLIYNMYLINSRSRRHVARCRAVPVKVRVKSGRDASGTTTSRPGCRGHADQNAGMQRQYEAQEAKIKSFLTDDKKKYDELQKASSAHGGQRWRLRRQLRGGPGCSGQQTGKQLIPGNIE